MAYESRSPLRTVAAVLLAALVSAGCSLALPAEDQCAVDQDCADRGFADARCEATVCVANGAGGGGGGTPDERWACLGNVVWDPPANMPEIPMHLRLARLLGEMPVPNAPAKVCPPLDITCAAPLDEGMTDAQGEVTLTGHYGFRGYTLISPPDDYPEMAPAIAWNNPPLFEETPKADTQTAHLTSVPEVTGIATIVGADLQPELGHVFGLTLDCHGAPVDGVTLSSGTVSPMTVGYYLQNTVPSNTASATDADGFAGFINLPGDEFITITATHVDHGKIGVVTALVKPGHVTYLPIAPSPL